MQRRAGPDLELKLPGRASQPSTPKKIIQVGEHHEGSGRMYMAHKMLKLREQFACAAEQSGSAQQLAPEAGIFKGVTVYVNGFTEPPLDVLRDLLCQRGGTVEAYYTADVTHMVANVLPETKLKELRKLRRPPTVVVAKWVTDCVAVGKLLPTGSYMVPGLALQKTGMRAFVQKGPQAQQEQHHSAQQAGSLAEEQGAQMEHAQGQGEAAQQQQQQLCQELSAHTALAVSQGGSGAGGCSSGGAAPMVATVAPPPPAAATAPPMPAAVRVVNPYAFKSQGSQPLRPSSSSLPATPALTAAAHTATAVQPQPAAAELESGASSTGAAGTSPPQVNNPGGSTGPGCGCSAGDPGSGTAAPERETKRQRTDWGQPRTSKDDPHFLSTFYEHSRLHHIGQFGARYSRVVDSYLRERDANGGQALYSGPLGSGKSRVILHVDMDCFFVSVMLRQHPELVGKAVAVAHTGGTTPGTGIGSSSEISSCSYAAREKGVRAGMPMGRAKELCPDLQVLPYDFEAFDEVSDQVYRVFHRIAPVVMSVSCDEAILELPAGCNAMHVASEVRSEILRRTQCPCSAGGGTSMLLARLATKRAKPNGVCYLSQEEAVAMLHDMPVKELPGVGYNMAEKLAQHGFTLCRHITASSLENMQTIFKEKTGRLLWTFAHGEDARPVVPYRPRKSLGTQVGWGVRFDDQAGANEFMRGLAEEVSKRLREEGCKARTCTLSLKRAKPGAPPPAKHLGHGICDNFSRSVALPAPEDAPEPLAQAAIALLLGLNCPPKEIRGLGLHTTRLVDAVTGMPLEEGGGAGVKPKEAAALSSWLQRGGDQAVEPSAATAQQLPLPATATTEGEPLPTTAAHAIGGAMPGAAVAISTAESSSRAVARRKNNGKARAAVQPRGHVEDDIEVEGDDSEYGETVHHHLHQQQQHRRQQEAFQFRVPATPPHRRHAAGAGWQEVGSGGSAGGSAAAVHTPGNHITLSQVTPSQVDPAFLAELPPDERDKLLATVEHAAHMRHYPPVHARGSPDMPRHGGAAAAQAVTGGMSGSGGGGDGAWSDGEVEALAEQTQVPTFPGSLSEINEHVLNALPPDVQQEVLGTFSRQSPPPVAAAAANQSHSTADAAAARKRTAFKAKRASPSKGGKGGKRDRGGRQFGWQPKVAQVMQLSSAEEARRLDPDVLKHMSLAERLRLARMADTQLTRVMNGQAFPATLHKGGSGSTTSRVATPPKAKSSSVEGAGRSYDTGAEATVDLSGEDACDDMVVVEEEPQGRAGAAKGQALKPNTTVQGVGIFELEPVSQIRAPLSAWLAASVDECPTGPSPSHLALLFEFVSSLVNSKRLDEAVMCLRCIRRALGESTDPWRHGYDALEAAVQAFVGKKMPGVSLSI